MHVITRFVWWRFLLFRLLFLIFDYVFVNFHRNSYLLFVRVLKFLFMFV